ncbi:MAG TPA: FtsQ-type POTRA domain-containing protein [Terriglobales bacterium]
MPRNNGPLIPDDPAISRTAVPTREDPDDALDSRLLDLDVEEEPAFLRAQKRIPVRRGPLPRKAANRLKLALVFLALAGVIGAVVLTIYNYGTGSWRFRLDSSDQLEVAGIRHVSHAQIMEVMGGDIGRNVFFIPLAERKKQLEEIPWVESASVMRLLPNRLKIEIRERTPVAFVQIGSKIALVDGLGVVMDLPAGAARKYSFPVIVGIGHSEPLSTRAARMKIFAQLVRDLDSGGANYSHDLSEVDLSDPEDVKVTVADPNGEVQVHLGSSEYLVRFKVYVAHIQEWRQQFQKVRSVDLRYDRQVIVNPDESNLPQRLAPPKSAKPKSAAKAIGRKKR